jgi:hypothetical protein
MRIALALLAAALGLGLVPAGAAATPAAAPTAAADPVIRPVRACEQLTGSIAIPGAATKVTDATAVPAGAEPAHCDVRGVIEPAVRFRLRLPTDTYAGRYLQYGCGGLCGFISETPFPDCGPRAGDFAVAATDDGHAGDGIDASWAATNQAARDDFFFRAPHVLSKAAKRIIANFYGKPPAHSYFSGCSTGGREGLLLAQRYPTDFDGIIVGAPVNYFGPIAVYQAWLARSNTAANGDPIITAAKVPVLHNAVVAACDRLDGTVDGVIDDPRDCRFDPSALRCPGADAPDCLTPAQVDAARRLYGGPTDTRGNRLYPGWQPLGSELAWSFWIIPSPDFPTGIAGPIADNYLRYLGYPIGTPHSSLAGVKFTVPELHRLTPEGRRGNAMSLDLGAFRRAGGKLILWHGWADMAVPPHGSLDYYARLTERNGSRTPEFARLFMVPNILHCAGGSVLTEFDPLRELVGWVERGVAPDRVTAVGRDAGGSVVHTRPVAPHVPEPRDKISWPGSYLHHIPGPVAR